MIHTFAWILGSSAFIVLLGVVYHFVGSRADRKDHPPPGRLVDLGTHRLHILELGSGGPTILLEAGLMSTVLSWNDLRESWPDHFESSVMIARDWAGVMRARCLERQTA